MGCNGQLCMYVCILVFLFSVPLGKTEQHRWTELIVFNAYYVLVTNESAESDFTIPFMCFGGKTGQRGQRDKVNCF